MKADYPGNASTRALDKTKFKFKGKKNNLLTRLWTWERFMRVTKLNTFYLPLGNGIS